MASFIDVGPLYRKLKWNPKQRHGKLNGLTLPQVMPVITCSMLAWALKMTSFNSRACSISKEMKHGKQLTEFVEQSPS